MRTRTSDVDGSTLREAKRQLERWRRGCRRPGRIPTDLWLLAAEAAAEHGIEETANELEVDAERLNQWVESLELVREPAESASTAFVELPPMPFASPGECQVELEDPSGRKLRLSLKGSAVAQLSTVLSALCGKGLVP